MPEVVLDLKVVSFDVQIAQKGGAVFRARFLCARIHIAAVQDLRALLRIVLIENGAHVKVLRVEGSVFEPFLDDPRRQIEVSAGGRLLGVLDGERKNVFAVSQRLNADQPLHDVLLAGQEFGSRPDGLDQVGAFVLGRHQTLELELTISDLDAAAFLAASVLGPAVRVCLVEKLTD